MTDNTIAEIRSSLMETIEDIGQAVGHLREAGEDMEFGNLRGARVVANDAAEILSNLETKFSELAARTAKWAVEKPDGKFPWHAMEVKEQRTDKAP